jgi:3'(2'), 5'-bisphosphate nucleotidase
VFYDVRFSPNPPGSMTSTDDCDTAAALAVTALRAGRAIMEIYQAGFSVEIKTDRSPVTEADRRAEALILADLAGFAPAVPVISEEAGAPAAGKPVPERFFLVDPLDGTREFINRNGEFTVNIALIEAGRPALGVVLAPAVNRLFVGCGQGHAFELPAGSEKEALDRASWRPIATRPAKPGSLRALASRSHRDAQTDAFLARIAAKSTVSAGSSLKFCLIACGDADVYPRLGRTMEWDTAAGQAVLEAAGGAVLTLEGEPLGYGKSRSGYANPPFVAWARREIAIF